MNYVTESGDTLQTIATQFLKDSSKANLLWAVNSPFLPGATATNIPVGSSLIIPDQLLLPSAQTLPNADPDECLVYVNGKVYGGWEQANISRSLEALSGGFHITATDRWDEQTQPWDIIEGDAITITLGSDVVITGWVDDVEPQLSADTHYFTIVGRDKTGDLVDCSAVNRPGEWRGKSLEAIVADICAPYGIEVITDCDTGGIVQVFRLEPGEKAFTAIERLVQGRQLLAAGDVQGRLHLKQYNATPLGITLKEGVNVLSARYRNSCAERYSHYIVEGQGDGKAKAATIRQTAVDSGMGRFRALHILADDAADQGYGSNRAEWEMRVRGARALDAEVTVQGWRMDSGALWSVDKTVVADIPSCRMSGEFLINDVEFSKSNEGTTTRLTLRSPQLTWKYKGAKKHKGGMVVNH